MLTMLRRGVEPDDRNTRQADHGAVLEQKPALRRVLLAEEAHRALRDVHGAPEVDLEQRARDVVRERLVLAHRDVPGVVEDDVDAPERRFRLHERGVDVRRLCHVELDDAQAVRGVLLREVVERGRLAERRDDFVAALESLDDGFAAEARRRAGDYEGTYECCFDTGGNLLTEPNAGCRHCYR